jgi:hypothetical protein
MGERGELTVESYQRNAKKKARTESEDEKNLES